MQGTKRIVAVYAEECCFRCGAKKWIDITQKPVVISQNHCLHCGRICAIGIRNGGVEGTNSIATILTFHIGCATISLYYVCARTVRQNGQDWREAL